MASSSQPATNYPLMTASCWFSHDYGEQSLTLQLLLSLLVMASPWGGPGDEAKATSLPISVGLVATE